MGTWTFSAYLFLSWIKIFSLTVTLDVLGLTDNMLHPKNVLSVVKTTPFMTPTFFHWMGSIYSNCHKQADTIYRPHNFVNCVGTSYSLVWIDMLILHKTHSAVQRLLEVVGFATPKIHCWWTVCFDVCHTFIFICRLLIFYSFHGLATPIFKMLSTTCCMIPNALAGLDFFKTWCQYLDSPLSCCTQSGGSGDLMGGESQFHIHMSWLPFQITG